MWRYVLQMIRRQPGKSALASSGFLLAACALILLSATTQTTVAVGNQIIGQNWRASYDLVVLPPQAKVPSQYTLPADLLEGYDGGISMQQYQQIKNLPGIEVAAPIAFVGYVQMPLPPLQFFTQPLPSGYYKVDLALLAFNGQRQVEEHSLSTIYYHLFSCGTMPPQKVLDALDKKGIIFQCGTDPLLYGSPPGDSGTFLLAAIDPAEENQLVHLDKSITTGRMLTQQDNVHFDTNPNLTQALICQPGQQPLASSCYIPNLDIPVLFHLQLPGQITLKGTFTRLASGTFDPQTILDHGGSSYLEQLSNHQTLYNGEIPLAQNAPQRFSGKMLALNGQNWEPYTLNGGGITPLTASLKFLYSPSNLTYQLTTSPDGQAGTAYTVVPRGIQGPEAAYRILHPLNIAQRTRPTKPIPLPSAFYYLDPVGQFIGNNLDAQFSNPLNWLPENTYTSSSTILRYDAQGNPVSPVNLLPTTNSAGFILQPPLAITTLTAAERLRGDHIISAIRIRVSGVQAANPASWKRVQQVAASIQQRTGLRVLVTLGSSPRPTLVYVPGVKQGQFGATHTIQPIGWVEERWIAIGASILYLAQLGSTRLLLLVTVLGVCLGYLVVAFSAVITAQRREFAILSALGWRPWQPAQIFLMQALLLALVGGIMGLGIALLITTLLEAIPIWLIVIWTLPAILVMALLSSLYPLWQIWHIQPAEILRSGPSVTTGRMGLSGLRLGSAVPSIGVLVVRNLTRSRPRTLISFVSLCLSTVLLLLMFSSILALRQTLTGTLLGNFVLIQTAVPQIAGCVFAVLLSFFSVADLLLLQVRDRQQEIGLLKAVGWRPGMIKRLFVQEGLILAIMSALLGILIAQFVLNLQHTIQSILPTPILDLIVLFLMILVSALATIPALLELNKMQVADILRAE
jgi:putative ABC transport system permease protein